MKCLILIQVQCTCLLLLHKLCVVDPGARPYLYSSDQWSREFNIVHFLTGFFSSQGMSVTWGKEFEICTLKSSDSAWPRM